MIEDAVADPSCDYQVELPQIVIQYEQLAALYEALEAWLTNDLMFTIVVGRSCDQSLTLGLTTPSDWICSPEKPVLKFIYSACRIAMETQFQVDQSCISLMAQDLSRVLRSAA